MKQHAKKIFITIALILIVIGTMMMLSRVLGGRLDAAATSTLVGGFTTIAVGATLLTREPLAVFFYFLYVLAFAIIQLPQCGIKSLSAVYFVLLFIAGVVLMKCLPKKRRR